MGVMSFKKSAADEAPDHRAVCAALACTENWKKFAMLKVSVGDSELGFEQADTYRDNIAKRIGRRVGYCKLSWLA